MNRILGAGFLVVGILLIVWGANASDSIASAFSKLFTGSPTEKSVYLVIAGALLSAVGAGMVMRSPRPRP